MRWPWERKEQSFETVLRSLMLTSQTVSGIAVTPENCMQSPTVRAIVTAVANRIAVSPVKLYRKSQSNGLDSKEPLPSHPIAKLLSAPNGFQSAPEYWVEATSALLRWGRFFAIKTQGTTGPIRELVPIAPSHMEIKQSEDFGVTFKYNGSQDYSQRKVHYVRLSARDFLRGDSPIQDIRESIALEIAAEKFGAAFFGNGAQPNMYFKLLDGFRDFKTNDEKKQFLLDVKDAMGGRQTHSSWMLPKGMDIGFAPLDNDKAQFIETRRFIRTVIAGAYGVPPHLVGDLERATFNNVEQQDSDFVLNVVLPIARLFEAAMERDLLTTEDRNSGVIIRFNLDAVQRADFASRQTGLQIQRQNGVISANEWREMEGKNPIDEADGGDEYIRPANMVVAGEPPADSTDQMDPGANVAPLKRAR